MKQTLSTLSLLLVTITSSSYAATEQPAASRPAAPSISIEKVARKLMTQGSQASGASLRPPETIEWYYKLFVSVRSLTDFPFTMLPGLGGADKTRFIADDLINRDELVHTTTYLKGQFFIALTFSPDLVKELQSTITVCEFLLHRFHRIASQKDAQGNLAISEEDIEALFFVPGTERSRS